MADLNAQVEHWACMEELRTLHSEFRQQGGQALVEERHTAAADAGPGPGSNSIAAEAPAEAPSADSFRQLLHALDLVQPRRGVQQQDNRQVCASSSCCLVFLPAYKKKRCSCKRTGVD